MRVAVKFAYDGTSFHGYQRQPDVRTVEGELVKALISLGAIDSTQNSIFRSSSRTDSGVSAIGNVFALNTEFRPEVLPQALNSKVQDIWVWGYAPVSEDFNPRHATQRWYRYYFSSEVDSEALRGASRQFIGEHNFALFAQRDERSTIRRIDTIEVTKNGNFTILDIVGESFLRGMIRKIAWAMEHLASGLLTMREVERALRGKGGGFGTAPSEPTVLMDVRYGFDFIVPPKIKETLALQLEKRIWERRLSQEILSVILSRSLQNRIRSIG